MINCRTPADIPSVTNQMMDSELQSVFIDVASLPTMITPVSDVDRAWCAPEYVDAVIAPPAVLPVVTRAPAAATSAVSNVLSPIRSPASSGDYVRNRHTSGDRSAGGSLAV